MIDAANPGGSPLRRIDLLPQHTVKQVEIGQSVSRILARMSLKGPILLISREVFTDCRIAPGPGRGSFLATHQSTSDRHVRSVR